MREKKKHNPPNDARLYRLDEGLKLSEVAFLLDIKNVGRVSEWENGLSNPGIEHFMTLSLIYHRQESQIYYQLKKKLKEKLDVRMKLLEEMKAQGKELDEGG